MNTTNQTQLLAVKAAFVLKSGGRGRPVKGEPGNVFKVISVENGIYGLAHKYRPNRTFSFTEAQVSEWFEPVEAK